MRRSVLVERLQKKFPELSVTLIDSMTDIVFDEIIDTLARGHNVEIRRFGTFFPSAMRRRILRNPVSGEMMEVPARRLPRFKAGRRLREKADRGD